MMMNPINSISNRAQPIVLTWLKCSVIILIVIGTFFRFVNLEQKAYWFDEASTSIQLSGYSDAEAVDYIGTGQVIGIKDLDKYQYPSAEKTAWDTVKGLAIKEPQLTPLYFVMARFWVDWLGNSVAVTRSFSAVISLLAFPCAYWLCLELFQSSLIGWMTIALFAVSPFHLLYAQEARPYSLWIVAILISHVALLRAMRLRTSLNWAIYAVTVAIGLYTFLFSALVTIGHGIYIFIVERYRWNKQLLNYGFASLIGLITFLPWVIFALPNVQRIDERVAFAQLAKAWIRNISLFFIDLNLNDRSPQIYFILFLVTLCILIGLVGYAIYFFWRHSVSSPRLFTIIALVFPQLLLILPDLILGGGRSTSPRYLIPSYLALQLIIAYVLTQQIFPAIAKIKQQKLGKIALVFLISIGLFSDWQISYSNTWWTKAFNNFDHCIARSINASNQPILISDSYFVNILGLSHQLDQKVKFQLSSDPTRLNISPGFSDVFLYDPSEVLKMQIGKSGGLVPIDDCRSSLEPSSRPSVWQLSHSKLR
jgi:uncharacterized membrane protein